MRNAVIKVIEDTDVFDRAYAELMKLPFEKGWERWGVFNVDGKRLYDSDDYDDCSKFLTQLH